MSPNACCPRGNSTHGSWSQLQRQTQSSHVVWSGSSPASVAGDKTANLHFQGSNKTLKPNSAHPQEFMWLLPNKTLFRKMGSGPDLPTAAIYQQSVVSLGSKILWLLWASRSNTRSGTYKLSNLLSSLPWGQQHRQKA